MTLLIYSPRTFGGTWSRMTDNYFQINFHVTSVVNCSSDRKWMNHIFIITKSSLLWIGNIRGKSTHDQKWFSLLYWVLKTENRSGRNSSIKSIFYFIWPSCHHKLWFHNKYNNKSRYNKNMKLIFLFQILINGNKVYRDQKR